MFESTISGIPCLVKITSFTPAQEQTFWEPAWDAEIEFEVLDRKGYRAKWLERKMTDADNERILDQCFQYHAKNRDE